MAAKAALIAGALYISACEKTDNQVAASLPPADHQRQLLDAFADTIVPKDNSPGAVEAGIPVLMLLGFDQDRQESRDMFHMLATIDRFAGQLFGAGFSELDIARREEVLERAINSRENDIREILNTLILQRSRIIRAFYVSAVGQKTLGYTAPYPEAYPDFNTPPPV